MTPERWRAIERVYHAALQHDAAQRATFLVDRCGGDEELLREVESLLAQHSAARGFIEEPAGRVLLAPIAAELQHQDRFVPGGRIGRMFGVYELKSLIAAGGMGEVYRAVDTRLKRIVAIKILPEHLSDDADRRQRFRREAAVISSLNHPHICTLYDIGTQDGLDYLVMEYIEGETLQARLARGRLTVAQALEYAIQIANALDKAHRRGVIHRDLKPGNVMLCASGVKLLDFGLATRLSTAGTGYDDAAGEYLTREPTVMGTLEYCSPEQIQGKPADVRTDIFSFGATVYEMISGERAFRGQGTPHLISAILQQDPRPIHDLAPDVPPALERALSRCLAKDVNERWQTANDLLFELRSIASPAGDDRTPKRRHIHVSSRVERGLWAAALLACTLGAFLFQRDQAKHNRNSQEELVADVRFSIHPAPGTEFESGWDVPFALSPNGREIVYAAITDQGTKQLWIRHFSSDSDDAKPLPGTDGAGTPFWSPDSEWVGFFADNSLKKIRLATGVVQVLANNVSTMGGAAWSAEDQIVFPGTEGPASLAVVSARAGAISRTTDSGNNFFPQFLPDGNHFLYADAIPRELRLGSVSGERPRTLMKFPVRISSLAYIPGYAFFAHDAALFVRPFDEQRLEFSGDEIRLLDGIPVTAPGRVPFSVSANGLLAYWMYPGGPPAVLQWFERDGRVRTLFDTPTRYLGFSLSHDGRRIAFSRRDSDGSSDVWIRDLTGGSAARFTFDGAGTMPLWSADDARIVYTAAGSVPPPKVFVKPVEGTADTLLSSTPLPTFSSSWSSDGKSVVTIRMERAHRDDLWVERPSGSGAERLSINTDANEFQATLSPDDRWLAYVTDASGQDEVVVANFPSGSVRRQASTAGGKLPQWSDDGRELYYVSRDQKLIAVPFTGIESGFVLGVPHPLFSTANLAEVDHVLIPGANCYVAASGRRLLAAMRVRDPSAPPIRIVSNWRALLHR